MKLHSTRCRTTLASAVVAGTLALVPSSALAVVDSPEGAGTSASDETLAARSSARCAAMSSDIVQANNPRTEASLVTKSQGEATSARSKWGFTEDKGVVFRAAEEPAAGLEPVYRLWHPQTKDFLWILTERGRDNALNLYGYEFQQTDFFVSGEPLPCGVPVYRYLKGDRHRLASSDDDRRSLESAGWHNEGAKFWAAAPAADVDPPPAEPATPPTSGDGDSTFTLAVIPDTQYDVARSDRLTNRTRWLVSNRDELDLRFVLHTGDVVDYDTPDHSQYENASRSLRVLDDAGVPTTLAVGNHDTAAVGVGGSARPGGNAKVDVRDTRTFNRYFSPSRYDVEGVYERGKIDNHYQLFSAGGVDWMILTLELWPRTGAVRWAEDVVARHPDHNVIVMTHSYLTAKGDISPRREYGANSPQYLYNHLVSRYPNIKLVFSGHVGQAAHRLDRGAQGNQVASFLGAFHTRSSNPIQLVEIDTKAGTVASRFYAPMSDLAMTRWDRTVTGMTFD